MSTLARVALFLAVPLLGTAIASAEPGMPVAVRWWGGDTISVESSWNLSVSVSATAGDAQEADLTVITDAAPADSDAATFSAAGGNLDVSLDRYANQADLTIGASDAFEATPNTVRVRSFAGESLWVLIQADAMSILYTNDEAAASIPDPITTEIASIDVLVLPVGIQDPGAIIAAASARLVVPIAFRSPRGREFKAFEEHLAGAAGRRDAVGNTTAISTNIQTGLPGLEVLEPRPWRARGKLGALLKSIDRKNARSQETFAPLSANQMNHKPSNGTHAPRWNVEHMAGTELAFFTAVYAAANPSIPAWRSFPAQMPPDYVPAHPEWTGAEEARRMQRVAALRNRFAYLLDGMDLDQLPRGGPAFAQSLQGMCEIVANHYDEHTAHVHKKFKLPDWPEE